MHFFSNFVDESALIFGFFGYKALGGKNHCCNGCCVVKCAAGYFNGVNNTGFDHVGEFFGEYVETVTNFSGTANFVDNNGTIKFLAMTQVGEGITNVVLDGESAPMIKFVFRVGEGVQTIATDAVLSTDVQFNEEVVAGVTFVNLAEDITVNLIGDFTGDGKYTVDDVLALQEIINHPELPYTNVGDFNNDGRISIADFAAFAKFITSKATVADYYTLLNGANETTNAIIDNVAGVIDVTADWTTILGLGTVNGVLSTPVAP